MNARVALHRQRRPSSWGLVEEPLELARVLREHAAPGQCLLVDCLTLWLTNLLMLDDPQRLDIEREHLLDCLASLPGKSFCQQRDRPGCRAAGRIDSPLCG